MKNKKPTRRREPPPAHPASRFTQESVIEWDYPPVKPEEVEGLVDTLLSFDEDEQAFALIKLLHGIAHAAYRKDRADVEGIVMTAAQRAYTKTDHFGQSLKEFSTLDPADPRDLSVITRDLYREYYAAREARGEG